MVLTYLCFFFQVCKTSEIFKADRGYVRKFKVYFYTQSIRLFLQKLCQSFRLFKPDMPSTICWWMCDEVLRRRRRWWMSGEWRDFNISRVSVGFFSLSSCSLQSHVKKFRYKVFFLSVLFSFFFFVGIMKVRGFM